MAFMEDMFGLKGKTAIVAGGAGVIGTMMCGALLKTQREQLVQRSAGRISGRHR